MCWKTINMQLKRNRDVYCVFELLNMEKDAPVLFGHTARAAGKRKGGIPAVHACGQGGLISLPPDFSLL